MIANILIQEERMKRVGYLFYLIDPRETFFESIQQVPAYITEAIPYFVGLIFIEQLVAYLTGRNLLKVNDAITSAGQGLLMEQSKILLPGFIIVYYKHIYDHYRIIDLSSDSILTWIIALLLIDFLFYWFHRACHEVNVLWATHQVHHSSEHFNLSTALRQSVPQVYLHILFYLPLALFLPPTLYLVHFELNTLFQFWIHTEILDPPMFLGYIFNTPSHHRVHHGRNRYCIDKNYASVLIVWDRLFGTFKAEDDPVVYGLTHPVNTFNPITLQVHSYQYLWRRLKESRSWEERFSVLFKGPGWEPGKPRLGLIEDIPDVHKSDPTIKPYDPEISQLNQVYCTVHFFIILLFHVWMTQESQVVSKGKLVISFAFILFSLTSFGLLMDGHAHSKVIELIRCVTFFWIQNIYLPSSSSDTIRSTATKLSIKAIYYSSIAIWFLKLIHKEISSSVILNKAHKKSTS